MKLYEIDLIVYRPFSVRLQIPAKDKKELKVRVLDKLMMEDVHLEPTPVTEIDPEHVEIVINSILDRN